jgi:hypothetical protein
LYLSSVGYVTSAPCIDFIRISFQIIWVNVTIVVMVVNRFRCLFVSAGGSVLLCDSTFKLRDGVLFQLLSHEFFFAEPLVFWIVVWLDVVRIVIIIAMTNYNRRCLRHNLSRFSNCFDNVVLTSANG